MSRFVCRIARLRVPLGGAVAILVLLFAAPTWTFLAIGFLLAVAGEAIRVWASGFIRKNAALATGGPYRHTRNPLYVGNLITGLGVVVAAGSWWLAAVYLGYYALCYGATICCESTVLSGLFPREYEAYRSAVPAFFPRLRPAPIVDGHSAPRFDPGLIWRNREYRSALATLLVFAILLLKILFPWP